VYVTHFSPRMLGLTGTPEEVDRVAAQYGVYFKLQKASADDEFYLVDHTSRTFVIDRDGELFGPPLQHGASPDEVVQALREALR